MIPAVKMHFVDGRRREDGCEAADHPQGLATLRADYERNCPILQDPRLQNSAAIGIHQTEEMATTAK